MRKIMQTLEIVSKYVDIDNEYLQGEHDIIFLPLANDADISPEDLHRLQELGAHKSREVDCWAVFT